MFSMPKFEVSDVLGKYGQAYRKSKKLQLSEHKVINAIQMCRTSILGGHTDKCSDCGYQRNAYNSCRNRHCPKCQGMNQLKWIDKRVTDLLPVNYFHLVFTIPQELNNLCLMNKKVLYGILFRASSETVTMLCADKKHLGAKPGIIAVLHTWGQNLMEHPHIHMIVTGGGLSITTNRWVNSRKKFFIPVKILSMVFRAKFLSKLKQAYYSGKLKIAGKNIVLKKQKHFKYLIDTLYKKPWVVYAKKPFGNAANVLRYLGRYTHRIAISNHRIVNINDSKVSFKWKDYANQGKTKIMTLKANEFIRRFLLHILPKGFCKIRYYGLSANRKRKSNMVLICKLLKVTIRKLNSCKETWQAVLLRLTGFDVIKCPKCKKGQMRTVLVFEKKGSI